ncbi:MAG: polysaccharide pyruvyl transferase family protein [Rhodobacteraceae bacterium]|nr:polysaccharide pyruvyl transferase family protein [Paracoccaceae bacterium]
MNILLVDLWTDANRGDNSLQAGLIKMCRKRWPDCTVNAVFRFGTNEFEFAKKEIGYTSELLDEVSGGLRRTYYSEHYNNKFSRITHKLLSLVSFLELSIFFILISIRCDFLFGKKNRKTLKLYRRADIIIWKGKNFRLYGGLAGLQRQLTLTIGGIIASWFKKPLYCVNASFWDVTNSFESHILKFAFRKCEKITVRDRPSLINAKKLLEGTEIIFAQDLSFYDLHDRMLNFKPTKDAEKFDLAITLTDWGSSDERTAYLDAISGFLAAISTKQKINVCIVPQVTRAAEDNSAMIEYFKDHTELNCNFTIIPGAPTIDDLLLIYSNCKFLIGTRMHSCVFAFVVGTPFVAIGYDYGPKWMILKEFWDENLILDYGNLKNQEFDFFSAFNEKHTAKALLADLASESFLNVKFL